MTIFLVYSFYSKINIAKKISKLALKKELAVCVNINQNINSLYIWKNKLCDEKEVEVSFKTTNLKVKKLISFLEKTHPYECPAIISFPIKKVNKQFLNWVNS
ncbi:MAG: Divalent-cation tolerance protein CutA, partial [Alphaproteobacteria bacterium MarineAlpha6_Bin6]